MDESGFAPTTYRPYGWGKRGHKVYGERSGHRRPRTSLIAARRGKDFLAPMLFTGTANAKLVNEWVEQMLDKELRPNSTIVFDNAAFHKKKELETLAERLGHYVLFLPPYSPDFNPVENDFANLKKIRQHKPPETPLPDIIKEYGNYPE